MVCQNLISNWRNDTQFSLTALEVLSGLAKIQLPSSSDASLMSACFSEGKKCIKWICDYITNQCSRPPPFHSKDMHSTIVAAYQCLTVWFNQHPCFLDDKECVVTVMEVIELGISGSKSKSGAAITLKEKKLLKPASMRVREAAEALMSCLMNHFGSDTVLTGNCNDSSDQSSYNLSGNVTGTSLLDEPAIVKNFKIANNLQTSEDSLKYFRYFVNDNSLLFAILKDMSTSSSEESSVVIIRSAFGKYCWTLRNQLLGITNHLHRSPQRGRSSNTNSPHVVCRPIPAEPSLSRCRFSFKYFPDSIEKIPVTKLDLVVPSLEAVVASNKNDRLVHDKVRKELEKQAMMEKQCQQKFPLKPKPNECREPSPSNVFEPVRLILTHFGLLSDFKSFCDSDENLQSDPHRVHSPPNACSMISLDQDKNPSDLWVNLKTLDLISTRTSDTVFIFYMRKGRSDPQEILNSVSSKHYVTQVFLDFLHSLGKIIDVKKHTGWTGNISSSWKTEEESNGAETDFGLPDPGSDHGGCAYDGSRKAIYWADVSHELVFVVPSGRYNSMNEGDDIIAVDSDSATTSSSAVRFRQHQQQQASHLNGASIEAMSTGGRSMSSDEGTSTVSTRSAYSTDSSSRSSLRNKSKQLSLLTNIGCDTKILIVWLESADDMIDVPVGKEFF